MSLIEGTSKGTSGDPVTDWLRSSFEHPFASRPLGDIDEGGERIKDQVELTGAIRRAVEILAKRAKKGMTTQAIRDACGLCLQFWKDMALEPRFLWRKPEDIEAVFGYPPKTHIVLSRMLDWQRIRVHFGKQKRVNGIAQAEMRDALEEAWCGIVLVGG